MSRRSPPASDTDAGPEGTAALSETERWLLRRGVPTFIHDYNAREDVFTRAAPFLLLVFLAETLFALDATFTWWQNAVAVVGALAFVVLVWATVNRIRGRRAFSLPETVGSWELAVFVLVPPLLELLFSRHGTAFLVEMALNVAVLGVVYVVVLFGLVAILLWAVRTVMPELGSVFRLFARALPLLLLFMTFLFINAEVWQVSAAMSSGVLLAVICLFLVLTLVFLVTQIPREVRPLTEDETWSDILARAEGTPVAGQTGEIDVSQRPLPLSRVEWVNVGLVVLFLQLVQIGLVTAIIAAFFLVFGLLVVPVPVIESWTQSSPEVLVELALFGPGRPLTAQLLRVSLFLAAFGGLYFAVTATTDSKYREEFFEAQMERTRRTLAVRAVYRQVAAPLGSPRS